MKGNYKIINVLSEIQKKNLLLELIEQISKDFSLSGVSLNLEKDCNPTQMVVILKEKINSLLKGDFSKLLSILYRIDVPENIWNKEEVINNTALTDKIIFQILQKEIQKIYFRNKNLL